MAEQAVKSLRIAVADDSRAMLRIYSALLDKLGHTVVCRAEDGEELLACCRGQEVDLVISDLDMPKVDGLAVAEEMADRGIPVILISGHPDAAHLVLDHEPVAVRIVKPASIELLRNAIDQALDAFREKTSRDERRRDAEGP